MTVNCLLKSERILRGWSQAKVAEAVGTDPVTVSRWERGLSFPYPHFREKLCALFGKNAEELGFVQKNNSDVYVSRLASTVLYDSTIPLPPTGAVGLVGRDAVIQQLRQYICTEKRAACVALHGIPGVGKTALAIHLAHDSEIRSRFCDGVLWVGLGPQPNILSQLSRWGALLEIAPPESSKQRKLEVWAETIHAAIGTRRMLLVIDDAWTIEAALAFKVGGPYCAHIVTTRFPQLALQFAPDGPFAIHELCKDDSMTLVAQWASDIVMSEQQDICNLIHLVGGLPLALTLMSKYLRESTYNQQPRRMHAALQLLYDAATRLKLTEVQALVEHHPSLSGTTHLSLQSVIMVSDQHLSAQAQKALRVLSIFPPKPNTFSEEAAVTVCNVSVGILDILSDAGLLESNGIERYTLHQTIFDYASLHYQEQGASERLITYFMSYIKAHKTEYTALELESSNILAAFDAAYTSEHYAAFVCMICTFAQFWHVRGLYIVAEKYLERAYEAAKSIGNARGQVFVLQHRACIHEQWGNYTQVNAYLDEGLTLARQLEDDALISLLLMNFGRMASEQGTYALAEVYNLEGLTLARKIGDKGLQSSLLKNLGYVASLDGDYAQVEAYYQEGLTLARQVGDPKLINPLLMNIAVVERERGNYKLAETYLHEGLALVHQMGHRKRICFFLINLGELEYERGDYTRAELYLNEGLQIARHLGLREKIVALLVPLGMVKRERGNFEQAQEYFQEGLALARQIEHRVWISEALRNLGAVALLQENYIQDEEYLYEALLLARQIQHSTLVSGVLLNLGALALHQKVYEQAQEYLQEGLVLAQRVGKVWLLCSLLFCLGDVYLKQQRIEMASITFNDMLVAVPKENQDLTSKALYGLARVAFAYGDIDTARMLGKKSYETLKSIEHYLAHEIAQWLNTLSPLHLP